MGNTVVLNAAIENGLAAAACQQPCPVVVREYRDSDRQRWDSFVHGEPSATFFHLSGWMKVMERTFQYRCRALYCEKNGKITGVLPLLELSNWLQGRCLISTPFAVYGGVAASDEESYTALVNHARNLALDEQVEYLELRNRTREIETGSYPITRYVTFTGELSSDHETNLNRLPRDTRYMIRKAQKKNLSVQHGTEVLKQFHGLMSISLRRLGTPMFPLSLFTNLVDEFGDATDLLTVYSGSKPVAAVLSFVFRDTISPYYVGAGPEAPALAANNFMYWELMQWAANKGLREFDFGRSKKGTGAYSFKSQWNMKVSPLKYRVFLVRKKAPPDFSPANPRFERATRVWSRLPLWLTKQAGPRVVRWFP